MEMIYIESLPQKKADQYKYNEFICQDKDLQAELFKITHGAVLTGDYSQLARMPSIAVSRVKHAAKRPKENADLTMGGGLGLYRATIYSDRSKKALDPLLMNCTYCHRLVDEVSGDTLWAVFFLNLYDGIVDNSSSDFSYKQPKIVFFDNLSLPSTFGIRHKDAGWTFHNQAFVDTVITHKLTGLDFICAGNVKTDRAKQSHQEPKQ